jgi:hypothetical protein
VKPERDLNNRASYRDQWWIFGEPRKDFRPALVGLPRYIVTIETAKHRFFVFLDASILPDNKLINIASDDAYLLGVLSSRVHVRWALSAGGRIGYGNDPVYVKSVCFDAFPFPVATPEQANRIRELGEKLDAHRKARQALYPDLTLTGMYNVLEAMREGRELTDKERLIHDQGLVTVLRQLHDALDAAVADAYGWPQDLPDEEILARLVTLNAERTQEEKQGIIRWLRPEYQTKSKEERKTIQTTLDIALPPKAEKPARKTTRAGASKLSWPAEMTEQARAVREVVEAMQAEGKVITDEAVASAFARAPRARVGEVLLALKMLGFVE